MRHFIGNALFEYENTRNSTLEEMQQYILQQEVIGLDIETSRKYPKGRYSEEVYKPGLDPYMSRVVMIQIGTLENTYIIDSRQFDPRVLAQYLKPIVENRNILKVGHNLKFEGKFFLEHYGLRLLNVWDTMLAEKVLYNGTRQGYSLEALIAKYLGIKSKESVNLFTEESIDYLSDEEDLEQRLAEEEENELAAKYIDKSTRLGFIEIGDKPFTQVQIDYGDDDIIYPLQIYDIQSKGRGNWNPIVGFKLENSFTQVLAEAEWNGVPFDIVKWLEAYEIAFKSYRERKEKLDNLIIEKYPQFTNGVNLFTNIPTCAIQWSSSKQVIGFFKHLEICPKERSPSTKRMEYTVGAKALFKQLPNSLKGNFYKGKDVEITDNNTLILQYLLYKKAEQLCTTFGKDWLKYVHPITGKVHTNYNQYMISSRLSSTRPNLQQIPGLRAYRDCFTFNTLINSDFSAQELRLAAEIHGVSKMMNFFTEGDDYFGEDLHSFNATQMFRVIYDNPDYVVPPKELPNGEKNKNFTKAHGEERDAAKTLAFLLNYGGSPFALADKLGISEDEALDYMTNYFKGLPGMEESFEKKKKQAVKRGWIKLDSYSNKRYFFPYFKKMQEIYNEVNALYPYNYREMSPTEKKKVKEELKATTNYSDLWREYFYYKGKLERRALNLPIQGAAATMTKLAGLLLYKYRWNNNVQDTFQIPIYCHDEILAVVSDSKEEEYAKVIEDLMAESGKYILKQVPMKAGAVISKVWEH